MVLQIKGKISMQGNSYFLRIPKALLDCKVLESGKEYQFVIQEQSSIKPLWCHDVYAHSNIFGVLSV